MPVRPYPIAKSPGPRLWRSGGSRSPSGGGTSTKPPNRSQPPALPFPAASYTAPVTPTLLLTGPIRGAERYAAAARSAGWTPIEAVLLKVANERLDPALFDPVPELLIVTSFSAVASVEPHAAALQDAPFATVGDSSALCLEAFGLRPDAPPARSATELARRVLALSPRPARVVWPRGSVSDELARTLRAGGIRVDDPVAYRIDPVSKAHLPELAQAPNAVFFASPSAVTRYRELTQAAPAAAIAIGPTTESALRAAAFPAVHALTEPAPNALAAALSSLPPSG